MRKTLTIELDADSSALSYELLGTEELAVKAGDGSATLYVNRAGCEVLAKIFAKMALGKYEAGFHIHMKENFGEEPAQDALTIVRR